ncbi:MAG TPA: IS481 family transposase [Gemmatimonadales bacterium]|nr:IS481 family transposase [Gemmatimonadales bacterium]
MHKNAKITPLGRVQAVRRVVGGEALARVAQGVGLSRRRLAEWVRRWEAGDRVLADRSSRPRRMPRRLPRAQRRRIGRMRRQRCSSLRIAFLLGLPISTVVTEQRRQGLARLPRLHPPPPVVRYQRERPGELLHLDSKKLGRIGRVGHRIHGDASRRMKGIGWEVLFAAIDDATRVAYSEVLANELAPTAVAFLERARAWYAARGIRIESVMTDNGSIYRSHAWRTALRGAGLRHLTTQPYTPRTNGKVERFIQTLLREWAYVRPYPRSWHRTRALRPYLRYYNLERPHTALGYRPPLARLRQ